MDTVSHAARIAERFVEPLGRRWLHVQTVAQRATELASAVPYKEQDTLVAAAWLHDIGYASQLAYTGFHPLDGARYLSEEGWSETIVNLVAHHSGARFEAEERGFAAELAAFPFADSALLDALVAADLTTGPAGERLTYAARIDEILTRYPADHPVHRTWIRARPVLAEAIDRTQRRLPGVQPR